MQYEYEMFFNDTSPVSIHGWWPIATDRIKDQSKIQEYIDKGILRRIDMKEQDAAHSFEKKTPSWYTADEMYHWLIREKYSEVIAKELCQKWSEDLQGAFNKGYEKSVKELTRLRSELQQTEERLEGKTKSINQLYKSLQDRNNELQQAKQEIANHIAVNSLLTDSDGEADLANKLHQLTSELQQKDEIIKELIVVAARISMQLKKGDSYRVHIESLIKKANVF